jgi:hypothetical protein
MRMRQIAIEFSSTAKGDDWRLAKMRAEIWTDGRR